MKNDSQAKEGDQIRGACAKLQANLREDFAEGSHQLNKEIKDLTVPQTISNTIAANILDQSHSGNFERIEIGKNNQLKMNKEAHNARITPKKVSIVPKVQNLKV